MSLNLKVEWKGNDITSTVSSITWSGSAYSSARSLEFSVVNPAGDTHFKTPDIKLGVSYVSIMEMTNYSMEN